MQLFQVYNATGDLIQGQDRSVDFCNIRSNHNILKDALFTQDSYDLRIIE